MRQFSVTWDVEWPEEMSMPKYERREFDAREAAAEHAKKVAGLSIFGVAQMYEWETVTRSQLDAALEEDYCPHWYIDKKRGLIWMQVGETTEVEAV